ncbi:MAG: hypothetical protein JNL11_00125 [Bdellovibrionaceae bacterium]|nr:hypothetical protein [Pseudobdellovibrionaceae bacterium]
MPANERIVDVGLAVLKAKIKLSCNFCESAADWSEYRKTVDAYFDFFDVKDAHGGFSGLPFAKFMETKFYDAEFQTHVIELFKRLQAISDSFKDKSYSLDTNIYKLALDVTGGDKSKSIELLGLMTSRDVLITRYLKYLRVSNPEFMHAFALTPVYARLITELDRKQSGTADDRFSYDGKAKTSDNRAYYFWSAALASKKLIEMGYGEKYVQRVSLEFPRQYKVIRYFEARGFLRDEKWKANFISGSFQAMRISGNGQRVGKHAVSDSELELPEKVNAYLNSLNIGRSVENFYKKEWLSSALHDGLLDGKAAILFYDFASSKVGFSHVKLIVGGRAFEIHRFKNSDGTYLRERDLMDSLLDSKPGVLPSGILEFNVDSEQAKDVLGHLSKASDSAMKYSFFNKMFNKDAFNCAGVIYDSLKKSGVPLPELARLDVTASQIFQRMVTGIPNARLLGKDGKWINNLVVPNLSRASFFGSTVKVNSDLKYAVGVETLKAEQGLSATTPLLSNLRNMLGVFVKNFSSNGNLDEVYIPKNANTLEITSVLLTPEQAGQVVSVKDASMIPNDLAFPLVDGKRWVRFFIHPATVAHFRTLIETAKVDPVKWIGTPSASARSLYIQDQQGKVSVFMIKTSLVERMGGSSRIINEERITRAVRVSEIVNGIHKASGGVLP